MTAQEFISAVRVNGSTVEVDSDIDFNDYIFTETAMIYASIINGNGHTLTNIQSNISAFQFGANVRFNRLNFRNLNLPSASLFYSTNTTNTKTFAECQFSGIAYHIYNGHNDQSANAVTFNRCSITIDRYNLLRGVCNECYIVLTRNLNTTDSLVFGSRLEHCYIKGDITLSGTTAKSTYMVGSCFNVNVKGNFNLNFNNVSGNEISIVNMDKLEGSFTPSSQTIGVTDAEMHDAAALYSKGFNIYVP